jgi:hypothetical protein
MCGPEQCLISHHWHAKWSQRLCDVWGGCGFFQQGADKYGSFISGLFSVKTSPENCPIKHLSRCDKFAT